MTNEELQLEERLHQSAAALALAIVRRAAIDATRARDERERIDAQTWLLMQGLRPVRWWEIAETSLYCHADGRLA